MLFVVTSFSPKILNNLKTVEVRHSTCYIRNIFGIKLSKTYTEKIEEKQKLHDWTLTANWRVMNRK